VKVIEPFLHQPDLCRSMSLCHKAISARKSTLRALLRWLRLSEWCTRTDVRTPLAPHPGPTRVDFCANLVRYDILVTKVGAERGGKGVGVVFRHVLARCTCTPFWPVRPTAQRPPTAQPAPHCVQQAPQTAMVCREEGGAAALANTHLMPCQELDGWCRLGGELCQQVCQHLACLPTNGAPTGQEQIGGIIRPFVRQC